MTNDEQTDLIAGKDIPPWLQPVPEGEEEAIEASARRKRLILTSTAAVVVIGLFGSVIWYLYDGADRGAPRHVAAPSEPVRERPDNAGGMQVAHQDKEVFNQVDGEGHRSEVQLGAQPEEPVAEIPDEPVEEVASAIDQAVEQVVSSADDAPSGIQTDVVERSEPAVEERTVAQPAPQPAEPEPAVEAYRVQLGAYGTEASASRAWNTIKGKFPDQLSALSPSYEAVQSGSRTLYRLRVGPLEKRADADQVCLALRAGQQACIVVNP